MTTLRLRADVLSGGFGPMPQHKYLTVLLEDLEDQIDKLEQVRGVDIAPVQVLGAESWKLRHGKLLAAALTIEVAPGMARRTLRSWYQWQHVRFTWSIAPRPAAVTG
jgi:hypothetical protein